MGIGNLSKLEILCDGYMEYPPTCYNSKIIMIKDVKYGYVAVYNSCNQKQLFSNRLQFALHCSFNFNCTSSSSLSHKNIISLILLGHNNHEGFVSKNSSFTINTEIPHSMGSLALADDR